MGNMDFLTDGDQTNIKLHSIVIIISEHRTRQSLLKFICSYRAIEALAKHDREVLKTGDEDGNTALHVACLQGHERVAKMLIKAGASIKAL